eukprot:761861-Hanusia_phi.AAC.2
MLNERLTCYKLSNAKGFTQYKEDLNSYQAPIFPAPLRLLSPQSLHQGSRGICLASRPLTPPPPFNSTPTSTYLRGTPYPLLLLKLDLTGVVGATGKQRWRAGRFGAEANPPQNTARGKQRQHPLLQ